MVLAVLRGSRPLRITASAPANHHRPLRTTVALSRGDSPRGLWEKLLEQANNVSSTCNVPIAAKIWGSARILRVVV